MNPKTLVIYRTKNACQFQPDFERGIVWVGFADAHSGASGPPKAGEQRYDCSRREENVRKNYNLKICPACGTEYHPNPAFLGWKRRYCSDACRQARRRLNNERQD